MGEKTIFIPVSLRLIQWTKETVSDGKIVQTPKQCYAHTTSSGRVMDIAGSQVNTTTTIQVNDVDLTSRTSGLSYAKWYWDMDMNFYDSMLELGLGKCFMKVTYDDTLANITNEELITEEEYAGLQVKPSIDDYLQATAI